MKKIIGIIKSEKGFYIGDVNFALKKDIHEEIWRNDQFGDGIYTDPKTGCSFAVAGIAGDDGTYEDQNGRKYDIGGNNIGLIPGELVEFIDESHYFEGAGEATFEAESGVFNITLPNSRKITIDTRFEK